MSTELEAQIDHWRGYVHRHRAIAPADVEEMEGHLRDQIADLTDTGLSDDEAFLVAVKRMGSVDEISREFAREHSERLWKQLVLVPTQGGDESSSGSARELTVVLFFAVGAAASIRIGLALLDDIRTALNMSIFVLPFLAGYFAWKRQVSGRVIAAALVPFAVAAVVVNAYPFEDEGSTQVLTGIHTPIALWFAVGLTYVGGLWRSDRRRMDFIRYTGEWVVYLALLGLGGMVLTMLTFGSFDTLDVDIEPVMANWILPCGAAGAVIIAGWLVEAKQNVVENIAPVLTRVFTPLTVVMLTALLVALSFTVVQNRSVIDVDRDLLILVDLILVLVLGLLLYAISARDPLEKPGLFDRLQLALVVTALAVDAVMLATMLTRIAEFGATPNKVAALGLNIVLLVNLAWSARLSVQFLRGSQPFDALERWQTAYVPVFAVWAAAVVIILPPVFGFV